MIRRSRGRAWFHVNWGYEESKHSLALEAWLLASGHRTEDQRQEVEKELSEAEWELPFDHPRQMTCYTMIQELATFWNYRNLEKMAVQQKDRALTGALRLISVDERVHYNFYRNVVKEWMKHDDRGTVEDLKYVFDNFTMPGRTQIPRYDEAARVLAKTGIYGPKEYVKLVKNPILEDLGLDRDFNIMEKREAESKAEQEQKIETLKREQIAIGNGHACPRTVRRSIGKPLNGNGNGSPLNSKVLNEHLANGTHHQMGSDPLDGVQGDGPKRSPLLDAIGLSRRSAPPAARSFWRTKPGQEPLPGSRGMDKYDNLDQRLMVIGDEISNNAEEMREERAKIRRNRVKNDRLFNKYNNEDSA
jgi:acyl-[acyl-carrier-protein] desaturase